MCLPNPEKHSFSVSGNKYDGAGNKLFRMIISLTCSLHTMVLSPEVKIKRREVARRSHMSRQTSHPRGNESHGHT